MSTKAILAAVAGAIVSNVMTALVGGLIRFILGTGKKAAA